MSGVHRLKPDINFLLYCDTTVRVEVLLKSAIAKVTASADALAKIVYSHYLVKKIQLFYLKKFVLFPLHIWSLKICYQDDE